MPDLPFQPAASVPLDPNLGIASAPPEVPGNFPSQPPTISKPQAPQLEGMPTVPPTIPPPVVTADSVAPASPILPASTVTPPVEVPIGPKRGFPKILIFLTIGVLLVLIAALVVKLVLPNLKQGGQGGTITWWGLWEGPTVVEPLIAEYENENPGVKIKYVQQSQRDYRERLINSLAKGDGPDIFRFHNSWVPMFRGNLDALPAAVMTPSDFAQTFYPIAVSDLTSGVNIVGIPLEYDGLTLFINEDIFAKAGKVPPATWDELKTTACQLTTVVNGTIDQAGAALGRTENVDHWQEILALMMLQNGANLAKPVDNLAEDAFSYFAQFSTNQACQGASKVWDVSLPSSTVAFAAGKLAMYFGPSWRAFEIKNQNSNLRFRTVPLPQLPKVSPQEPDISLATYWVEGVWSKSKNKTAAWDFLKFMASKDSLAKLYENAVKVDPQVRPVGEPYPRLDMADLLVSDPILGSIISQAPFAKSWFLASRTWDGPTGVNSQIGKYYEDAVNSVASGGSAKTALTTVAQGVAQVLGQYGIAVR